MLDGNQIAIILTGTAHEAVLRNISPFLSSLVFFYRKNGKLRSLTNLQGQSPGRTDGQADSSSVTQFFFYHLGFAVFQNQCPFCTGTNACPAAVAQFFVDFHNGSRCQFIHLIYGLVVSTFHHFNAFTLYHRFDLLYVGTSRVVALQHHAGG